jgi:hypothetical protein
MLEKMASLNREDVVSLERDSDCAVSRQMSASLIKLDFRPVSREAKKETFTKNSEISKTSFILSGKVCCLLPYFSFLLVSFLFFPFLEMK